MSKAAKTDSNPSGIIKVSYDDIFNSPSWKKARAKALAYDPIKKFKHVAKAPPASPNQGTHATEKIAKRAKFFVGQDKVQAKIGEAKLKAPKAPVKAKVAITIVDAQPKAPSKPKKAAVKESKGLDYFSSPEFRKARRKALSYDPFKGATHIAKAPPASMTKHATILKQAKLAKKPKAQPKPQPSLTAGYVSRPGHVPEFTPARVIKNQAQLNNLIAKGNLDLLSAVAYCDPRGRVHTGSVLEIYSMLPSV